MAEISFSLTPDYFFHFIYLLVAIGSVYSYVSLPANKVPKPLRTRYWLLVNLGEINFSQIQRGEMMAHLLRINIHPHPRKE